MTPEIIKSQAEKQPKGLAAIMKRFNLNIFKRFKQEARNNLNVSLSSRSIQDMVEGITPNETVSQEVQQKINNEKAPVVKRLSESVNKQLNSLNIQRLFTNEQGEKTSFSRVLTQVAAFFAVSNIAASSGYDMSKVSAEDIANLASQGASKLSEIVIPAAQASDLSSVDFHALKKNVQIDENLTIDKNAPLLDDSVFKRVSTPTKPVVQKSTPKSVEAPIAKPATKPEIKKTPKKLTQPIIETKSQATRRDVILPIDTKPLQTPYKLESIQINKKTGYAEPKYVPNENVTPKYTPDVVEKATKSSVNLMEDPATLPNFKLDKQPKPEVKPVRTAEEMIQASQDRQKKMNGNDYSNLPEFTLDKQPKPVQTEAPVEVNNDTLPEFKLDKQPKPEVKPVRNAEEMIQASQKRQRQMNGNNYSNLPKFTLDKQPKPIQSEAPVEIKNDNLPEFTLDKQPKPEQKVETRSLQDMIIASKERQRQMQEKKYGKVPEFTLDKQPKPEKAPIIEQELPAIPVPEIIAQDVEEIISETLPTAQEAAKEILPEGRQAILLENEGNFAFLGDVVEKPEAEVEVIEEIDGVKIIQTKGDTLKVLAVDADGNYRSVNADYLKDVTPALAQKLTGEGVTPEDIEAMQDKASAVAFDQAQFEQSEGGSTVSKQVEEILQGKAYQFGRANPGKDIEEKMRRLGVDPNDNGSELWHTINVLQGQSKEENIKFWKDVESWREELNSEDSTLTQHQKNIVGAAIAMDINPTEGLTSRQVDSIMAELSPSQGMTKLRASLLAEIDEMKSIDPAKYAAIGNGTESLRVLNKVNSYLNGEGSVFASEDEVQGLFEELNELNSAARSARPEESVIANDIADYQAKIQVGSDKISDFEDFVARSNALAKATGSQQRATIVDGKMIITDVDGNSLGSIDYEEAKQSFGINPLKTAMGWLTGTPTISFNHKESTHNISAQPGAAAKMDAMRRQGTDKNINKESFRLIPKDVKKTIKIMKQASIVVPALKTFIPPALLDYHRMEVQAGDSSGFIAGELARSKYGPAITVATDAIANKQAILDMVNQGSDSVDAMIKVLGVSKEEAQQGASLLYLMSKADSTTYSQVEGAETIDIEEVESQEIVEFAKKVQAAAGVEIDIKSTEEVSRDFVSKYNSLQNDLEGVSSVRKALRNDVAKFENDKTTQTRLMNALSNKRVGELSGTNYKIVETTLGTLGNKTVTGDVIALNTVGENNNSELGIRVVRAPQDTVVYTVVDSTTGEAVSVDGAVNVYYDQCANGVAINPGSVLKVDNLKENKICMGVEICPIDEELQFGINPNIALTNAQTIGDDGRVRSNAGSNYASSKTREHEYKATKEAVKREYSTLRDLVRDKENPFGATPNTVVAGIPLREHLDEMDNNPEYRAQIEELMNSRRFTELLMVDSAYDTKADVTIGGKFSKDSQTKSFTKNFENEKYSVERTYDVTQTTKREQGSLKSKWSEKTQAAVLTDTIFKIRQARLDAGLSCEKIDEYITTQLGISIEQQGGELEGKFKNIKKNTSVKKTDKVTKKPEPKPEPKPAPIEENKVEEPAPSSQPPANTKQPAPVEENNPTTTPPQPNNPQTQTPQPSGENNPTAPTPSATPPNGNAVPAPTTENTQTPPAPAPNAPGIATPGAGNVENNVVTPAPAPTAPGVATPGSGSVENNVVTPAPAPTAPNVQTPGTGNVENNVVPPAPAPTAPNVTVPTGSVENTVVPPAPAPDSPDVSTPSTGDVENVVTPPTPPATPAPIDVPTGGEVVETPTTPIPEAPTPDIDTDITPEIEEEIQTPIPGSTPGGVEVPTEGEVVDNPVIDTPQAPVPEIDIEIEPEIEVEPPVTIPGGTPGDVETTDVIPEIEEEIEIPEVEAPIIDEVEEVEDIQVLEDNPLEPTPGSINPSDIVLEGGAGNLSGAVDEYLNENDVIDSTDILTNTSPAEELTNVVEEVAPTDEISEIVEDINSTDELADLVIDDNIDIADPTDILTETVPAEEIPEIIEQVNPADNIEELVDTIDDQEFDELINSIDEGEVIETVTEDVDLDEAIEDLGDIDTGDIEFEEYIEEFNPFADTPDAPQ